MVMLEHCEAHAKRPSGTKLRDFGDGAGAPPANSVKLARRTPRALSP
jgi:hypothetical protein